MNHLQFFSGRTAGRKTATHFSWPMLHLAGPAEMRKALLIAMLSLLAASCGVKNELAKPDGTTTPKSQPDPSRPPYPIGR